MTIQKTYGNHTIGIGDDMQFTVSGPLFDEATPKTFVSFAAACEAIDKRQKEQENQDREKLSISVVDEHGIRRTITGIHGGHFGALGIRDAREVYPPEDWLIALLRRKDTLSDELREIHATVAKYRILTKPYGLRSHEQAVASIKREAQLKSEAAAKDKPATTEN